MAEPPVISGSRIPTGESALRGLKDLENFSSNTASYLGNNGPDWGSWLVRRWGPPRSLLDDVEESVGCREPKLCISETCSERANE